MIEKLDFDVDKGEFQTRQSHLTPVGLAFENYISTPMEAEGIDLLKAFPTPALFVEAALKVLDAIREGEDVIGRRYADAKQYFPELQGNHEEVLDQLPMIAERLVDSRYGTRVGAYMLLAREGDGVPLAVRRLVMHSVRNY